MKIKIDVIKRCQYNELFLKNIVLFLKNIVLFLKNMVLFQKNIALFSEKTNCF